MAKPKKRKFDNERIHYLRSIVLLLITICFLLSAGLSVYTFFKTKEIIEHKGIYKKHRDYSCRNDDSADEAITTGTVQQLNVDSQLESSLQKNESKELNANSNFTKSDRLSPSYPASYSYGSVGNIKGLFTFDKFNHTIAIFLDVKEEQGVQANWYMNYIPAEEGKSYVFDTSFRLEKANAHVVVEEVDSEKTSTYTDLSILSASVDITREQHVFMPKADTVKLRFYTQLTGSGSLTIFNENVHSIVDADSVSLVEPLVSLSFDDGWSSVFTAAKPVMDSLGVKSTQYIIAESFRSLFSGYMSLKQVKELQTEGHEIASHSLRHCNLKNLSLQNADYDLRFSKQALETEFKPISGFAYPYGGYDEATNKLAAEDYAYIRTTDSGYDSLLMDRYRLKSVTVIPEMTMEEFKEIVDFAVSHNLWLDLVYHQIEDSPEEYGVSAAMLRRQISYIKAAGIKIMPVEAAVENVTEQQESAYSPK